MGRRRQLLSSLDDLVVGGARKVRRRAGLVRPPKIVAYRGYGTRQRVVLRGRVLEAWRAPAWPDVDEQSKRGAFAATSLRFLTAELADHPVVARVGEVGSDARSDEEGFVRVVVDGTFPAGWSEGELDPEGGDPTAVRVMVPHDDARLLVVSDLDDTVLETGVADTLKMIAMTLTTGPGGREVTPGVATLFTALARTSREGDVRAELRNPIFYLSSSPWNLHGLLERVLEHRRLPEGPLLLSDWGFTPQFTLRAPALIHKGGAIRHLLELYPQLPMLLVGDSGEHDPEVYAAISRDFPDRIAAILIRDLPDHPTGDRLADVPAPTCAAADWEQAAAFLAGLGWLRDVDVVAVRRAIDDAVGTPGVDADLP